MNKFIPYLDNLRDLLSKVKRAESVGYYRNELNSALNGQPLEFLRDNIDPLILRASGAFFTSHKLSNKLASPKKTILNKNTIIFDPACGAGDLLLAQANILPVFANLGQTLSYWGSFLYGYDIHEEFIKATKLRLVILAIIRTMMPVNINLDLKSLFPNIEAKNFLDKETKIPKAHIVLLNPPYTRITNVECKWGSGLISCAGLFVTKCIEGSAANTIISALLPDVLRTGSHYKKWREFVAERVRVENIEIIGRFDPVTDVDVFHIRMRKCVHKKSQINWNLLREKDNKAEKFKRFSDFFNVHVGPVVPFRDIKAGESQLYIDSKTVVPWKTIRTIKEKRKYNKTLYKPPFVVIKRTSGPSDKMRAVASIIIGTRQIAVENHLIILQPKNKSLEKCRCALQILKSTRINDWLNKRIRCRHLTVSAISEMPWFPLAKADRK